MKICPCCNGLGEVASKFDDKRKAVRRLRNQGATYYQIMRALDISSTSVVWYYLNSAPTPKTR